MSKTDKKKPTTKKAAAKKPTAKKKVAPKAKVAKAAKKPAAKKNVAVAKTAKILSIIYDHDEAKKEGRVSDYSAILTLEGGGSVKVDRAYTKGCGPIIGGFYVCDKSGKESFKPAK